MYKMTGANRKALLIELFDTTGTNIGVSYLRISVGSSDLDEFVFSYDDMPAGQTDPELKNFSLGYSLKYLIPLLK
jgi:glucosylceramidase